jgi:hypothetical protein
MSAAAALAEARGGFGPGGFFGLMAFSGMRGWSAKDDLASILSSFCAFRGVMMRNEMASPFVRNQATVLPVALAVTALTVSCDGTARSGTGRGACPN